VGAAVIHSCTLLCNAMLHCPCGAARLYFWNKKQHFHDFGDFYRMPETTGACTALLHRKVMGQGRNPGKVGIFRQ
jgi:hypothetical protein